MLAMFLIGAAEVMAGPMMGPMGLHFRVSSARVAWLPGSYALVYACLAPFLGPISDRFGRKVLLVPGLFGLGTALTLIALASSFWAALAFSAIAGVSAAAIQPNTLAIINDAIEPRFQLAATGRVFVGLTLSFVITPVASGFLAARIDWRAAYFLASAASFTASVLVARLPIRAVAATRGLGFRRTFVRALTIFSVRKRLAATFLWLGLSAGVSTILAEILHRRFQLGTEASGVLVGAFGLATLTGSALIPWTERIVGSRPRVVIAGVVATMVGCLVVGVAPPFSTAVAVFAALFWALGYGTASPVHHSILAHISGPVRGTVIALNASVLNLGIVAVAGTAGRFFDQVGVEAVMSATVAVMLVGLILLLSLPSATYGASVTDARVAVGGGPPS